MNGMTYSHLGRAGLQVSRIGLGAWSTTMRSRRWFSLSGPFKRLTSVGLHAAAPAHDGGIGLAQRVDQLRGAGQTDPASR